MRRQISVVWKVLSSVVILGMMNALSINSAYAVGLSNSQAAVAAFRDDPSAPTPIVQLPSSQPALQPVSRKSDLRWQTYDQPIRECIKGNSIIPSNGNDVFAYMFKNQAPVDVNMAIQGWQQGKCAINFTEGMQTEYCQFPSHMLEVLLQEVLNGGQFNTNSSLAQVITEACQSTNPALSAAEGMG